MKYRKYSRDGKELFTAEWQKAGINRTVFTRTQEINIQKLKNCKYEVD